jgi:hypothetical protein
MSADVFAGNGREPEGHGAMDACHSGFRIEATDA